MGSFCCPLSAAAPHTPTIGDHPRPFGLNYVFSNSGRPRPRLPESRGSSPGPCPVAAQWQWPLTQPHSPGRAARPGGGLDSGGLLAPGPKCTKGVRFQPKEPNSSPPCVRMTAVAPVGTGAILAVTPEHASARHSWCPRATCRPSSLPQLLLQSRRFGQALASSPWTKLPLRSLRLENTH